MNAISNPSAEITARPERNDRPTRAGATASRRAPKTRRRASRKSRVAAFGLSVISAGAVANVMTTAGRADAATATSTAATYTGTASTNRWGTTQVKITVKSGKITEVSVLSLPSSHRKSERLSTNAATILRAEVLSAQSADVDTVSGATMTSISYLDSLQSAIDSAVAAGKL